MKILMLTPYLPYPPASGGQIRTLNLLKYLSKHHEITLIALYKHTKEKEYSSHLREYCNDIYLCKRAEKPWQLDNILTSVFSMLPFLIVRNYSVEARKTIEHLLKTREFDVIHAETFYIMPHIPVTKIPILLVEQTIEYKVYQHFISRLPWPVRLALSVDILKLRYWEKYYWQKATVVASVSQADEELIKKEAPRIAPVIIPNGAGDEMFVNELKDKDLNNPSLLFVGNFYWLQNTEAATYLIEKIFSHLKKAIPSIRLIIAGQNAKNKMQATSDTQVEIVDIPQDSTEMVKKLYQEATVFIAPIFGPGGTRLKILAAMASGLPVVSTQTGVEGLGVKNNEHVLIANDPNEFVKQTVHLLKSPELYSKMRSNAHTLANKKYSWQAIATELESVYRQIRNPKS